jgi:hypothetical protein
VGRYAQNFQKALQKEVAPTPATAPIAARWKAWTTEAAQPRATAQKAARAMAQETARKTTRMAAKQVARQAQQ